MTTVGVTYHTILNLWCCRVANYATLLMTFSTTLVYLIVDIFLCICFHSNVQTDRRGEGLKTVQSVVIYDTIPLQLRKASNPQDLPVVHSHLVLQLLPLVTSVLLVLVTAEVSSMRLPPHCHILQLHYNFHFHGITDTFQNWVMEGNRQNWKRVLQK